MVTYNPKTETLYNRGDDFKVTDKFRKPEFGLIKDWTFYEKVDGTSVILHYEQLLTNSTFYGRTARSKFNSNQSRFMVYALRRTHEAAVSILATHMLASLDVYAELVGPDLQGNPYMFGGYRLYVFDMRVNDKNWLDSSNVENNCAILGLDSVPFMGVESTHYISELVRRGFTSAIRAVESEGVVMRTDPLLYDNRGNRIVAKLKHSDF